MKKKKSLGISLLFFCAILLVGCDDKGAQPETPDLDEVSDLYMNPSVPRGKTVVMKKDACQVYLGAGYDIMGSYISDSSVKGRVIDLERVDEDWINCLIGSAGEGYTFEGEDSKAFLRSIMSKREFESPTGDPSHVLFAGTLTENPINLRPYDYSSQYAFILRNCFDLV